MPYLAVFFWHNFNIIIYPREYTAVLLFIKKENHIENFSQVTSSSRELLFLTWPREEPGELVTGFPVLVKSLWCCIFEESKKSSSRTCDVEVVQFPLFTVSQSSIIRREKMAAVHFTTLPWEPYKAHTVQGKPYFWTICTCANGTCMLGLEIL